MECFSLTNPNPTLGLLPFNDKLPSSSPSFSSFPATSPFCFRSELLHRRRSSLLMPFPPAECLAGFSLSRKRKVSVVLFAASWEHSKPSEAEIKMDLKQAGKAFLKGWKQDLASFKERVVKLQSEFQEVCEECSEEADVILKEDAAELEIQIDEARQELSILTEELHEEGRQCLILEAEIALKPVKDVVETFASANNLDDISKICNFYIGIPYGAILSVGGFLDFMITGSISAIRFGVILGGILLALSNLA